jgi:cyclic nucleotide gated channel
VLIWIIIPNLGGSTIANTKNVLRFIIIFQYLPRLFLIFPLSSQIVKATGVVTETAWAGAAYNLMLYMLASHVNIYISIFFFCLLTKNLMLSIKN